MHRRTDTPKKELEHRDRHRGTGGQGQMNIEMGTEGQRDGDRGTCLMVCWCSSVDTETKNRRKRSQMDMWT